MIRSYHSRSRGRRALCWASLVVLATGAWTACASDPGDSGIELTSVSPARISARGGDTVTLRGAGFSAAISVRLGGEPVKALEIVSATEARFTAPPLFAGLAQVAVATARGGVTLPQPTIDVLPLDLRFVEAPEDALPSRPDATVTGAAVGDFDGDGSMDLITCAPGTSCRFLANDGRGNFTDTAPVVDPDAGPPEDGGVGGAAADAGKVGVDPRFPAEILDARALIAADFDGGAEGLVAAQRGREEAPAAGCYGDDELVGAWAALRAR